MLVSWVNTSLVPLVLGHLNDDDLLVMQIYVTHKIISKCYARRIFSHARFHASDIISASTHPNHLRDHLFS